MKQLLFNLTRHACYLRRADMKKFKNGFSFLFVCFFLVIASALKPVSASSLVSLSVDLWLYFTVWSHVLFNPSRLKKQGLPCILHIQAVTPTSVTHSTVTGTSALLILAQGQHGVLCLVNKLRFRQYCMTQLNMALDCIYISSTGIIFPKVALHVHLIS